MTKNQEKRHNRNETARKLKVSPSTIDNWYNWYNNPDYPKPAQTPPLPVYEVVDGRGTRMWSDADIKMLRTFMAWRPKGRYGVMGDANARYWGTRGERAKKNKSVKVDE